MIITPTARLFSYSELGFRSKQEGEEYLARLKKLMNLPTRVSGVLGRAYDFLSHQIDEIAVPPICISQPIGRTPQEEYGGCEERVNASLNSLIYLMTHGPEVFREFFYTQYARLMKAVFPEEQAERVREGIEREKSDSLVGRLRDVMAGTGAVSLVLLAGCGTYGAGTGTIPFSEPPAIVRRADGSDSKPEAQFGSNGNTRVNSTPLTTISLGGEDSLLDIERINPPPNRLWLLPDRVYLTATYSGKGPQFLKSAKEAVRTQVEGPLSRMLGQPVDVKEWSDSDVLIITPGLALGWDINRLSELFFEFSYGSGNLKTSGSSPNSYILPGYPNVNTGPADYRFNIGRENTAIGLGPIIHLGDLANTLFRKDSKWLGRGRFDPYLIGGMTYSWSSSDFDADVRFHGADVSSQFGYPPGSVVVPPTRERQKTHNSDRGPGYALGAGFNAPISKGWDLTTTARYNWTHLNGRGVDFDLNQWTIAVGFVYPFGRPSYGPGRERWNMVDNMIIPILMDIGGLFE